jgi:hypothetical protein
MDKGNIYVTILQRQSTGQDRRRSWFFRAKPKRGARIRATSTTLYLCRIDASRNMRRFYRLGIELELFGGF